MSELYSALRLRLLRFTIHTAQQLQVSPVVKYSALSLFMERFYPSLSDERYIRKNYTKSWLLNPLRESSLQLFAIVSIWISSKMHESRALPVKSLKSLGDKMIKEQHFIKNDYLEAEVVMMKVLNFEIGTSNNAFRFLENLFFQFEEVAIVGKLVNFEACLDIMDLLYEKEDTLFRYISPVYMAASVLVASYVITVPNQKSEFPVIPWVKFVTSCKEEKITQIVIEILKHVFHPSSVPDGSTLRTETEVSGEAYDWGRVVEQQRGNDDDYVAYAEFWMRSHRLGPSLMVGDGELACKWGLKLPFLSRAFSKFYQGSFLYVSTDTLLH